MKYLFYFNILVLIICSALLAKKYTDNKKSEIILNEKNIDDSIIAGKNFLRGIQNEDGSICDTLNPLFNIWETIIAAQAVYLVSNNHLDKNLDKAISYLKNNENKEGLICHNSKCKESYCIETTALYLKLIKETDTGIIDEVGLQEIALMQEQNGDWLIGNPDVKIDKNFPSVTAFALSLMSKNNIYQKNFSTGMNWLISKQNSDGHWASSWEYYGTPAYAMWQVIPLLSNSQRTIEMENSIYKTLNYIINTQKENGSWNSTLENSSNKVSPELQTGLLLDGLISMNYYPSDLKDKIETSINRGIIFLLNNQNTNGSWNGGHFPIDSDTYKKEEYVFATSLAITSLFKFKSKL